MIDLPANPHGQPVSPRRKDQQLARQHAIVLAIIKDMKPAARLTLGEAKGR